MISEPLIAGIVIAGPMFLGLALLAKSRGGWIGWGSFSVMILIAAFGRHLVQYAVDLYLSYFSTSSPQSHTNTSLEQAANNTAAAFNSMQDTYAVSETVSIILMLIFQLAFLVLCISIYRKVNKARLPGPN